MRGRRTSHIRIARIARTATITTYVVAFNRDGFVRLFVIMVYSVPKCRRGGPPNYSTHSTRSPACAFSASAHFTASALSKNLRPIVSSPLRRICASNP